MADRAAGRSGAEATSGCRAAWETLIDPQIVEPEQDPALAAALRELAPRRRLIVFLRYFADLDYASIAEVCQIDIGTVAATLAQARSVLAEALVEQEVKR